ncbi:MAG: hypothetical protein U1F43_32870 [Myxococcota bacterium]
MAFRTAAVPALAAALAALAGACSDATTPACRVGADCASGVCNGDGSCAPLPDAGDATVTADADAASDDSGDAVATSPDAADANTSDLGADVADDSDGDPRVCTPVDDDRIAPTSCRCDPASTPPSPSPRT